jgi:hypothetical protein
MANNDEKLTIRIAPKTRRRVDQWYKPDGCRSRSDFIEKAINFYVSYLTMTDDNRLIPRAISSAMEGQLGMFKKEMAAIMFKLAVEQDMTNAILTSAYQFSDSYARNLRSNSVKNVRQTNGHVSLEKYARKEPEEDEYDTWPV